MLLTIANTFSQEEEKKGYKEEQLTHTNADNRYASYNKSGKKIVFESNRDGRWQIYTMDIKGNHQKPLFKSSFNDRRPTWHPYKDIVIFESNRNGVTEIYTYNLETNSIKKVPIALDGNKSFARFAPNGVQVIFSYQTKSDIVDIYMCSNKGKRLKKIIANKHVNLYPHFSPRGDNVIYYSNKNTQGESNIIYSYNIITEDRNRLTYFKDHSEFPNWSNIHGRRVTYSAKVDDMQHSEIFIMRNDAKRKIQITYNDVEDILPTWSPNDVNLLITGYRNGHYQICRILLKKPLDPNNRVLDYK
ncbi:PD40 domain-containing protein [Snuella sedimenti]|uniref:PD40 domain-containing protein n=1 Tax=Snuella sedimenti TaxID=2798802 RepID=A0A8J7LMW7_9FLAO|nr:PD40 domain-containing protein [Snuella sedimenti]MBJ6367153.1 PD40 domain-containing protein [Snuella sedimenti]